MLQRSLGWLIGVTLLALCCEAGTAELASPQYLGTRKMPPLDVNKLIPRYEPHHIGRSDRDVRRQAEIDDTYRLKDDEFENELGPFEVNKINAGDLEVTILEDSSREDPMTPNIRVRRIDPPIRVRRDLRYFMGRLANGRPPCTLFSLHCKPQYQY